MDYTDIPMNKIGRIVTGKTPSTKAAKYYGGDIMFVTPAELHTNFIVEHSVKTITKEGYESIRSNTINGISVMVGCIGWDMGNVALCTQSCATNQQINSITDIKPEYNPLYLYYWLKTKKDYLFSIASVTRTPILNKSTFEEILVPIPKKNIQDSIAQVLSVIDKKIMLNKRINDNLEQQIRTIYNYWFLQFEFPDSNGKPYKSNNGQFKRNNTLNRDIPINWSVESLACNKLSSLIKPGVEVFDTKTYYATADVKGTEISEGSIISFDNRESRANMQPTYYSVWFAKMKNSVKHLYLNSEMKPIIERSILSTGFCGLQCDEVSFEYISSFIDSPYFEMHKDMLAHGATQEAVNNDDLERIYFLIPDNRTLQEYHQLTKSLYSQISQNICENKDLIALRDWLLPMLMNGQVTTAD